MYSLATLSSYSLFNGLILFRFHELVMLFLVAWICFHIISSMNSNVMHAPKAFSTLAMASMRLANNTDFSYPLGINHHLCWPKQLLTCLEKENSSTFRSLAKDEKLTACCSALFDPSSEPFQSIDGDDLIYFGLILPVLLLAIRTFSWWMASRSLASSSVSLMLTWRVWLFFLSEAVLTLIFASTYQTILMEVIKASVGAPRPIFHALNIWASAVPGREPWRQEAHRSFPSGHSATASSGLGVILILLLRDAHLLLDHHPTAAKVVAHLSLFPLGVIVYVGVSRIRDYWHFPVDVVGELKLVLL